MIEVEVSQKIFGRYIDNRVPDGYNMSKKVGNSYYRIGGEVMLAELRTKSQITIPKEIVTGLGLEEGDKLEIFAKDGMICMMPVTVYPRKYVAELRREIDEVKSDIASGRQPVFTSLDSMFDKLEGK